MSAPASVPVGFIGLGRMGAPIARRLRDRGVPLVVHNRTRERAGPVLAAGATWAESPRDVGRAVGNGVVFTLVTDGAAVRSVVLGRAGVARGLSPGSLVADLSTIAPTESRTLAERLSARAIGFVDAPLGGSVDAAADGSLLVFAGGPPSEVDRLRPLLATFARRVERLGPVGAGTSMKLVNNLLTIAHAALAAEALALAESLGVDRERALDLLLDGGGQSRMLAAKRAAFSHRDYATKFSLALAAKDLALVERAARGSGTAVPIARSVAREARAAVAAGWGERDFAVLLEAALGRRAPTPPAQTDGPVGR